MRFTPDELLEIALDEWEREKERCKAIMAKPLEYIPNISRPDLHAPDWPVELHFGGR